MKIEIREAGQGMTIEAFLKKQEGFTAAQIRGMKFRENGICLNGNRARVNQVLKMGDMLTLKQEEVSKRSSQIKPQKMPLEILYEDEALIAVWKPSGILIHPGRGHWQDTLSNYLQGYFAEKGQNETIRSIGRLDLDTSGIMVFARDRVTASRLWKQKEDGRFFKQYLALCRGVFPQEAYLAEQSLNAPIGEHPVIKGRMCVCPQGKKAETRYQVLQTQGELSLVRVRILTGRTHQIRVHLSDNGHPLAGDPLYGREQKDSCTQLSACRCELIHPYREKKIVLQVSMQADYKKEKLVRTEEG